MSETLTNALISILYGAVVGVVTVPVSKRLVLARTEDPVKAAPLGKAYFYILSVAVGIIASFALVFTASDTALMIRNLALLIPLMLLSYVDILIRKIPNSTLLAMIIVQVVYAVYYSITNKTADIFPKIFVGFMIGMLISFVPGIFKIPMGAGDKKLSAVIGICIYAVGYFQSMIIMAILVALFYLYLKISKKGNIKTLIPMGPFLSVGAVVSMCYMVFNLEFLN